ncbi:MAG: substrate-binding domain-containing protein [Pseudomonadota bacterium]
MLNCRVSESSERRMVQESRAGRWAAALLLGLMVLISGRPGYAEPLKVLTAGAFKQVLLGGLPQLETIAGTPVQLEADTVGGLIRRVAAGERFDVLIASPQALEALKPGGAITGNVTDLARVGVGVGVKDGAARPPLATVDQFRDALLQARAVAYVDPAAGGTSGIYLSILIDRLGIGPQVRAKAVLVKGGNAAERIVSGEADLALQQISEILPVKGVVLAGPLPAEIQSYTTYSAATAAMTAQPAAAAAVVSWLRSAAAAELMRGKGMEPAP